MEEEIRERIKTVFSVKGYTSNKLSKGNTAMQNRLSRQMRGATITAETLVAILTEFPDISADWLVMGRGEMIKQTGKTINVYRQGGDGEGQTNVVGDGNEMTDKQALKMALEQNQKLIDAILKGK